MSSIEDNDDLSGRNDIIMIVISGGRPARPDEPRSADMEFASVYIVMDGSCCRTKSLAVKTRQGSCLEREPVCGSKYSRLGEDVAEL